MNRVHILKISGQLISSMSPDAKTIINVAHIHVRLRAVGMKKDVLQGSYEDDGY